jgi:hypothetical protein
MRGAKRFVLAACIFALATWALPWPVIPIVAALMVLAAPRAVTPLMLACAAGTAWAGILAWTAFSAPLGILAAELGGIVHLPGAALVTLTVALAAGLAWGGAEIALVVRARARPQGSSLC